MARLSLVRFAVRKLLLALIARSGSIRNNTAGSFTLDRYYSNPSPCPYQGRSTSGSSQQHVTQVCESFCSGRCSFFNASAGEAGLPTNLTLYRMTPHNVTDAANKDLADIPGDIGFFLSRKTLRLQCAQDPRSQRCFLAHNNSYASFEVQVDGRFGSYLMCNPAARSWGYDTSEFLCALDCLTPPQCGTYKRNGTSFHGDYQCYCARTNRTVGRQPRRGDWTSNAAATGASLPSQCDAFSVVWPFGPGHCLDGQVMSHVRSSRGDPAVEELLCEACNADPKCVAWTRLNATYGTILGAVNWRPLTVSAPRVTDGPNSTCISARKAHGSVDASISALFSGIGAEFGGYWYSLPAEGECGRSSKGRKAVDRNNAADDQLGVTCSWRLVSAGKRVSAGCLEGHVDRVVELWNARCFDKLGPRLVFSADSTGIPHQKNKFGNSSVGYAEAYLQCYLSAILGDPAQGLGPLNPDSLVAAWRRAFEGGCEPI